MDSDLFEHDLTDYPLKGGHAKTKCAKCHKKKDKYRDAPSGCIKCHKNDDVHEDRLGNKCADCHSESSWRKPRFDHDKTKFKLKGEHKRGLLQPVPPQRPLQEDPEGLLHEDR